MKKSLRNLVHKLESNDSKKLEGGFTVLSDVRGGKLLPDTTEPTINEICSGTNPSACSNQRQCSDTTNTIGCHNYGTCFSA